MHFSPCCHRCHFTQYVKCPAWYDVFVTNTVLRTPSYVIHTCMSYVWQQSALYILSFSLLLLLISCTSCTQIPYDLVSAQTQVLSQLTVLAWRKALGPFHQSEEDKSSFTEDWVMLKATLWCLVGAPHLTSLPHFFISVVFWNLMADIHTMQKQNHSVARNGCQ